MEEQDIEEVARRVTERLGRGAAGGSPGGASPAGIWSCPCGRPGASNNFAYRMNCRVCLSARPVDLQVVAPAGARSGTGAAGAGAGRKGGPSDAGKGPGGARPAQSGGGARPEGGVTQTPGEGPRRPASRPSGPTALDRGPTQPQ